MPGNGELRRTQAGDPARVQPVELAVPGRGVVAATQGQPRTRDGSTAIVRPGALTQLLADLARAPEGAGWEVPLAAGDSVGRFEILREIGRGGFGVVYEARDTELGRSVAFKAIRASGADTAREARALGEAEAAARLAHPNIVHLYDLGRAEQGPYLILELLRGRTLAEELCEGPLPLREAVRVAVEISRGLAHAHQQGVLHRDLKPSNVFLCDDGQVKVLDFGLAHVFGRGGAAGGTPGYMAPEQSEGEPGDERSDVFSLGVVVREMLTGKLPPADVAVGGRGVQPPCRSPSPPGGATDASPLSPAAAGERGQPTVTSAREARQPVERKLPSMPAAFAKLVERMHAPDPAARPAHGGEAHGALLAVQKSLEPKRLLWAGVSVAAAAVVGAGIFAWVWQRPLPPGRLVTVLADAENTTGDPDLDGVSELLRSALDQSRRVAVMSRSRLVGILRGEGAVPTATIGEARWRAAARTAEANVLVLPSIRPVGDRYGIALRAVDVARDETLFSLRESAGAKLTVPAALERLVVRARRALREEASQAPPSPVAVERFAPANAEALGLYAQAMRLRSGGYWPRAQEPLKRSIAADPDFLLPRLAVLEDAMWTRSGAPMTRAERDEHISVLRRGLHRIPARERAWADYLLGGGGDEAEYINHTEELKVLDRLIEAAPDDPRPYLLAAKLHIYQRADAEAGRPYVEKANALTPYDDSPLQICPLLLAIDRPDEALTRALKYSASLPALPRFEKGWPVVSPQDRLAVIPSQGAQYMLADVYRWRGELDEATEIVRRGAYLDHSSLWVLVEADALEEAEAAFRRPPEPWWLALRGRIREALAAHDRNWSELPHHPLGLFYRGFYALSREDPDAVWRETEALFRAGTNTHHVLCNAWQLAAMGDVERASRLEGMGLDNHLCHRMTRAILMWRRGDRDGALARLADIAAPSSHLYRGEILFEMGREREAVEHFRRYRRLHGISGLYGTSGGDGAFDEYLYPRSLYLEAAALERLGEREEARMVLGRLLRLWDQADRDLPLLARAKALQKRLGASSGNR